MSSKKVEDAHVEMLSRLLSDSGLECIRSPKQSFEESTLSGEFEELDSTPFNVGPPEELSETSPEVSVLEERTPDDGKEAQEELPDVFPTASLRRLVPARTRKIEEENRIHVLPDEFRTDIDPNAIPRISVTPPQQCIDVLAEMVGCDKYRSSLAEFWFLDTMANLLRRAQEDELDRPTQAVLILWFCEWMKEIQYFDAADRQRMLSRFKDNMLSAAKFIGEKERIPTPFEAGVSYKGEGDIVDNRPLSSVAANSKHLVTFEGAAYECSLKDLTKIIHYIFDLFSTDYQYKLVRSVFTFPPEYIHIDAPYQIHSPKSLYAPLKMKGKKEKSPKRDTKPVKGKRKETETEEYLALLELMAKDEREQEERDELERESWNQRSHILPLNMAATEDVYNRYWPPPPPEPEPQPEPELKAKLKKSKK